MVTGILHASGAWVGHTVGPHPRNPKGFFENEDIRELIVKPVLEAAGVDPLGVDPLPSIAIDYEDAKDMRIAVNRLIANQGYAGGPWAYKDAKLLLQWRAWHAAYPDATWVVCRRDPADIIQSCLTTDFMMQHSRDPEFWAAWSDQYHSLLQSLVEDPVTNTIEVWPDEFFENPSAAEQLVEQLGLDWDAEAFFRFVDPALWKATEGQVALPRIEGANHTDDELRANTEAACRLDLPWMLPVQEHGGTACVVGGGPSMLNTIGNLRKRQKGGARVIAMNGAHDYLIKHNIIPEIAVCMDVRDVNASFYQKPDDRVLYFIASSCHPDVFKALEGYKVIIWHPNQSRDWQIGVMEEYASNKPWSLIGGGGTIGTRALCLLRALGFLDFHLYGMDSCLKGEDHHIYSQPFNDGMQIMEIKTSVSDKVYHCHPWMARQADEFRQFYRILTDQGCRFTPHGKGLLQDICIELNRQTFEGKAA